MNSKVNINKKLLEQLPYAIRLNVTLWKERYKKRSIQVEQTNKVYVREDAHYTAYSPDTTTSQSIQASGEYAGLTKLSPTAVIDIPDGCTVVEEDIFCGTPFLNIYHNSGLQLK
jgi:hypothetical protein